MNRSTRRGPDLGDVRELGKSIRVNQGKNKTTREEVELRSLWLQNTSLLNDIARNTVVRRARTQRNCASKLKSVYGGFGRNIFFEAED